MLNQPRTPKEPMLEPMPDRIKLHSSGESSTLMERMPQEPRVLTPTEDSISTDHSTFNLDCGWKESSVLLEDGTLLSKTELTIIRDRFGSSIKHQRLFSLCTIERDPWMLEVETPMPTPLTQDGTNSSNMKVMATLSMKRSKSLLSKVNLIPRTDRLLRKTPTIKITRNGTSCTLTFHLKHQPQDLARAGECTLTDHSISKLECLVEDSWIISPTEWLSRSETEDQLRPSTSIIRLEPLDARDTTTTLLISETHGPTLMELTAPGTNSSSSKKVNSSTINTEKFLMLTLRMLKANTLLQPPRMERFIKSGESSMLIKLPRKLPRE